jgi:microcystin-dependent protein
MRRSERANRAKYRRLWKMVGDSYGSSDGKTTFNLPDFRGLFLRGVNHGNYAGQPVPLGGDSEATQRGVPRPEIQPPGTTGQNGDNVGSLQPDKAQVSPHEHGSVLAYTDAYERSPGSSAGEGYLWGSSYSRSTSGITGGATAWETRPRNAAVMFLIFVGRDATDLIPRKQ